MRRFGPPGWRFSGYDEPVDCPEACGKTFSDCLGCEQYQVWRQGDAPRCRHEFEELKGQGYYKPGQEGWMEYLSVADPETHDRLKEEEEEDNRRVREWLEAEKAEMEAEREVMARELEELKDVDETTEPDDEAEKIKPDDDEEDEDGVDEDWDYLDEKL